MGVRSLHDRRETFINDDTVCSRSTYFQLSCKSQRPADRFDQAKHHWIVYVQVQNINVREWIIIVCVQSTWQRAYYSGQEYCKNSTHLYIYVCMYVIVCRYWLERISGRERLCLSGSQGYHHWGKGWIQSLAVTGVPTYHDELVGGDCWIGRF